MASSIALTNRSIRKIKTELEFLADLNLLDADTLAKIFALLPPTSSTVPNSTSTPSVTTARSTVEQEAKSAWRPTSESIKKPAVVAHKPALPARVPKAPSSVAENSSAPAPVPPEIPPPPSYEAGQKTVKAIYSYTATDPRDLNMEAGDEIVVISSEDENWWYGRCTRTGEEGQFPQNRVTVISEGDRKEKADINMMTNVAHGSASNSGFGSSSNSNTQNEEKEESKLAGHGKKFGSKLGNAAIFGAGATMGSKIVNGIF